MSDNLSEDKTMNAASGSGLAETRPVIIALVLVGLLILGYIGYLWMSAEPEPVASIPVVVQEAPVVEVPVEEPPAEVVVEVPAEPAFVLPTLDASDPLVRDGVLSLTREEDINVWLGMDELVRKFVVVTDNVAQGNVPRNAVQALAPKGPFPVTRLDEETFMMDPAGYRRYDDFTRIFTSLDSTRAVEFFDLLRPLFATAYAELGYKDQVFEDTVFKSIGRLLETPELTDPVRLVRPVVMYRYEDPRLEGLSPAQKQLLRMGPDNVRAIKAKLSEMATALRAVLDQ